MWETRVIGARPSVLLLRVGNGAIWFSTERDWSQECNHGNNLVGVILLLLFFVMYISCAKFGENCSNISGDILIQYLVL